MIHPADVLAVFAGVDWAEQGRKWQGSMLDPASLYRMPFIRWCGMYLPVESPKETIWKMGNGTTWKDVRAEIIRRKKAREAASGSSS